MVTDMVSQILTNMYIVGSMKKDEFSRVNATHGWGFCTLDCERGTRGADKLQIVDQTILPPDDCAKLSKKLFH